MERREGNTFENNVAWYLEHIFNGIVMDKGNGQKYYTIPNILRNIENTSIKLDTITHIVESLQQTVENQTKIIEEQASIIKRQHESIVRFENDVIYKTQKDLIMELIGIADQLRYILNDYAKEKDFDSLYSSIKDLTSWVDGSLQAVAVRKHESTETKELDRKRQEIIENIETQDPDEDGKIRSLLPGYIWSVPMVGCNELQERSERPKLYEFMIRPEQVARLKYVKHTDDSNDENSSEATAECVDTTCMEDETTKDVSQDSSDYHEAKDTLRNTPLEESGLSD